MSIEPSSYILRIPRDELLRHLYIKRSFYVGIKRDWSKGTRVLFIRKDEFCCFGVVDRFVERDVIGDEREKMLCLENNWYGKIVFSKLVRFQPAVPIHDTPVTGQNPISLDGATISSSHIMQIQMLAHVKIIL